MVTGRLMALDVGNKRIGVAVTDPLAMFSRPLTTVERTTVDADVAAIAALIEEHEAVRLVVGHPLLPSGDRGEQAERVEAFVADLVEALEIPIEMWDESHTTVAAAERLAAQGVRGDAAKAQIDEVAAAVILEEWLRARGGWSAPPVMEGQA